MTEPFWRRKSLDEMTDAEWESLCDGCGQCCLNKLEDADTGEIALTWAACKLLDLGTCQCSDYANRFKHVPNCINMTPESTRNTRWLPQTCAYRLIDEGKDLYWWHHLVSGDPNTVHQAGVSVRDIAVHEDRIDDLEDSVIGLIVQPEPAAPSANSPSPRRRKSKRLRRT